MTIINNDIENRKNIIIEANHKNKLSYFLENIENLFKKLKDYDLEIENSNEENSQDSNNRMKFIKSAIENKSPTSLTENKEKEFDILSKQNEPKSESESESENQNKEHFDIESDSNINEENEEEKKNNNV